jgi:hypothetical protein
MASPMAPKLLKMKTKKIKLEVASDTLMSPFFWDTEQRYIRAIIPPHIPNEKVNKKSPPQ